MPSATAPRSFAVLALALALIGPGCGPQRIEGQQAGDCSDRADNDMDGLFDCDDEGCTNGPSCDDDSSPGDDDSSPGDDDTSPGDDDFGDDDGSPGDDDTVGDDDAGDDDSGFELPECCEDNSCPDPDDCLPPGDDDDTPPGSGEGFDNCHGSSPSLCPGCYDGKDNDGDGGADCQDPEALSWDGSSQGGCAAVRAYDGDPSSNCP